MVCLPSCFCAGFLRLFWVFGGPMKLLGFFSLILFCLFWTQSLAHARKVIYHRAFPVFPPSPTPPFLKKFYLKILQKFHTFIQCLDHIQPLLVLSNSCLSVLLSLFNTPSLPPRRSWVQLVLPVSSSVSIHQGRNILPAPTFPKERTCPAFSSRSLVISLPSRVELWRPLHHLLWKFDWFGFV